MTTYHKDELIDLSKIGNKMELPNIIAEHKQDKMEKQISRCLEHLSKLETVIKNASYDGVSFEDMLQMRMYIQKTK